MAIKTEIKLSYNAQRILEQWARVPDVILAEMARGIDYQNELTIGHIQAEKLSERGPETLGVRSGHLRRSLRRNKATYGAGVAQGAMGSNISYLGVHEFGFRGTVRVKSHTRKRSKGKAKKRSKIRVKAHDRRVDLPARRMIKRGIEERLGAYSRELSGRVIKAWRAAHT